MTPAAMTTTTNVDGATRRARLGRLLRYARPYRRAWGSIALLSLLATATALLQPWPMKLLADHVLRPAGGDGGSVAELLERLPGAGSSGGLLAWISAAGLLLFAANAALEVVLTMSWVRVGQAMVYDLAADLFARTQRRSLQFHARHSVGDSMCRVAADSYCVYTIPETLLLAPARAVLMAVAMFALMWRMNPTLAVLSVAVAPLMTVSSTLLASRLRTTARDQRELESQIHAHVQQTLSGVPVVQAFGQEDRERERFERFADDALRAARRSTFVGSVAALGTGLVTTVGTAVVLWVGARQVLHGSLTVGSLLVFLAYLNTLQGQLKSLAGLHVALQTAGAKVDRVCEVLEADADLPEQAGRFDPGRIRGHLRLEDVTFGYEPGRPVLRGVCVEARPGEVIGVVGPTGAGKSTLVGLALRLFDPWEGRVTLDGHDSRSFDLAALRRQIAVVLQEPFLFPRSVADNIAFGRPGATHEEIEAAARAANADAFIRRLPGGYDAVIGERGATLSGGQRQRIGIARALLMDAPVLVLDEPTSAIDAGTEQAVLEALGRLMRGRTTLVIAHRLSTVADADRIVVLDNGHVAESGTHEELLASAGLYSRLHAAQFGTPESGKPRDSLATAST